MQKEARTQLIEMLHDYTNDYLTIGRYAGYNGLTSEEAVELMALARKVESHPHPEA